VIAALRSPQTAELNVTPASELTVIRFVQVHLDDLLRHSRFMLWTVRRLWNWESGVPR
jgi:hypothetical protein